MIFFIPKNRKGFLRDREPITAKRSQEYCIRFENAPSGFLAIFSHENGAQYYRDVIGGLCSLPGNIEEGRIRVDLSDMKGKNIPCEDLLHRSCGNGEGMLLPMDDLPTELAESRMVLHELECDLEETKQELASLKSKYEKMMEGYKLV